MKTICNTHTPYGQKLILFLLLALPMALYAQPSFTSGPKTANVGDIFTYKINLNGTNVQNYSWSVGTGGQIQSSPAQSATEVTVKWTTPGVYLVRYVYEPLTGAESQIKRQVTVSSGPPPAKPVISILAQATCSNANGQIKIDPYDTNLGYAISPSTGTSRSGDTFTVPAGETYTVTASNANGTSAPSNSVELDPQPTTPDEPDIIGIVQPSCSQTNGEFTVDNYDSGLEYILTPSSGLVERAGATFTVLPGQTYTLCAKESTYFAKSGSQVSCTSDCASIVINAGVPALTGGTISEDQIICYNGDPEAFLSDTDASGSDGSYSYQWQIKISENRGWTNITTNGTDSTYDPPSGLTGNRWYRRRVQACNENGEAYSNTVKVTVRANLTAGAINGVDAICYNGDPDELTGTNPTGGTTNYSYQWQYSTNGSSGWQDITGATSASYDPPAGLDADSWYRREVQSCGQTKYTAAVKIMVRANLTAGAISGADTICYDGDPDVLTSSTDPTGGTTNYSYQWQYSNNGSSGWANVTGNGTSSTYNP
ncbi:MAG: hypothetical protein AB3N16_03715, partial [Flavobacteriaceae bacterium]